MKIAKKSFKPGRGYTEAEWNEADVPPLTDEELAQARPFAEVFPELAARMRKNLGGLHAPQIQSGPSAQGSTPTSSNASKLPAPAGIAA